jgi:hypothetical protein
MNNIDETFHCELDLSEKHFAKLIISYNCGGKSYYFIDRDIYLMASELGPHWFDGISIPMALNKNIRESIHIIGLLNRHESAPHAFRLIMGVVCNASLKSKLDEHFLAAAY